MACEKLQCLTYDCFSRAAGTVYLEEVFFYMKSYGTYSGFMTIFV